MMKPFIRTPYFVMVLISVFMGLFLYGAGLDHFSEKALMWMAYIPFTLFIVGVLGPVYQYFFQRRENTNWMILLPLTIIVVYFALFAIHTFILEPLLCPALR